MKSLLLRAVASTFWWLVLHRKHWLSALRAICFRPWLPIRVSIASLLRLELDNRYLLVRNLHRQEHFTPMGGVIKFFPTAKPFFDSVGFVLDPVDYAKSPDRKDDLRGSLRTMAFPTFIKWFESGLQRESADHAMRREVAEELAEIGVDCSDIDFQKIQIAQSERVIYEGPSYIQRDNRRQFRMVIFFEIVPDAAGLQLIKKIEAHYLGGNNHMIMAAADEIAAGRAENGDSIGGISNYLFRSEHQIGEPAQSLLRRETRPVSARRGNQ